MSNKSKSKFYGSEVAAIRHAINAIGPDWEKEYVIFPVELPNGETFYSIMPRSKAASRASTRTERRSAIEPSFIPKSRIEGATRKVWDIADIMKGKPRRDVLEECRRQGIATGTAATQYQRWKTANKR